MTGSDLHTRVLESPFADGCPLIKSVSLAQMNRMILNRVLPLRSIGQSAGASLPTSGVANAGRRIPRGRYDFVEGLLNPNGIVIVEASRFQVLTTTYKAVGDCQVHDNTR